MGTFHEGLGDLHGITIVVETRGAITYIGRCHEENDRHVLLHDADSHDASASSTSREDYLARAARYGVFPRHRTLAVPRSEVTGIRRLVELAREAEGRR